MGPFDAIQKMKVMGTLFLLQVNMHLIAGCAPEGTVYRGIAESSPSSLNQGILGGEKLSAENPLAQSTVSLLTTKKDGKRSLCTGTLISSHVVVTAAHCLENEAVVIEVRFGTETYSNALPKLFADAMLIHPAYDFSKYPTFNVADIALLHLKGDLPTTHRPAKILRDGKFLAKGSEVTVAGFGKINPAESSPGILNFTKMPVHYKAPSEVVLDQSKTGICSGDSGGPAAIKQGDEFYVWGVASRTVDGCKDFAVYTDILAFLPWIEGFMKKFEGEVLVQHEEKALPEVSSSRPSLDSSSGSSSSSSSGSGSNPKLKENSNSGSGTGSGSGTRVSPNPKINPKFSSGPVSKNKITWDEFWKGFIRNFWR